MYQFIYFQQTLEASSMESLRLAIFLVSVLKQPVGAQVSARQVR